MVARRRRAGPEGPGVSALAVYRGLLSNRPLVRLLGGEFVSSIGDWLYLVALLVVVYRESNDPVLLGIVGGARVLPYVLLSVPAGIAADRFDRRMVLFVTDVARGSIMVILAAIVLVHGPLWSIIALAIIATCFSSFFGPAIGSYIPALVRDERELGPANSAWATFDNLAFIVGPGIAGLLVAFSDLAWAFILNAATFAVVAAVLWYLPASRGSAAVAETEVEGGGGSAAGPATFRSVLTPVAGLTLSNSVAAFVLGGVGVLTVLLAVDRLGGEAATGYLNAAVGVGGLLGALGSGALVLRPNLGPPLLAGAVVMGIGLAGLGASGTLLLALVTMAVASAGSLATEVVGTTIFQRVVPDAIRGRVLGGLLTFSRLAYALGSLALPVLAAALGVFPVLAAAGIAVVVSAGAGLLLVGSAVRLAPSAASEALRRVSGLPVLTGVPPAALEAAAAQLRPVPVAAGEVIVREGDPADRFYIIEGGRFLVDQLDPATGEQRRLRALGPGEVFGELGLLRSAPRSATVTAETDGSLLALDAGDFLALVNAGPGLSVRLLNLYGGRSA